jgi:hypothetical protein
MDRELGQSRDHVLTAKEFKTGRLFPFHTLQRPRITDCLRFSPGGPDHDRIIGIKRGLLLAQNYADYSGIRERMTRKEITEILNV